MDTFRHVILTRFNVKIEQSDRPGSDWLEHRFSLFERFRLPSVKAQTCGNFVWVIFCDPDIPLPFRDRIFAYAQWKTLRPIFFRNVFEQGMARAAVSNLARGHSHLITSRLDNDDAICRTFVESVQHRFRSQEFEFLNFTNGYILDTDDGGRVWSGRHTSNAFISLVERTADYSTVYCGNHTELHRQGPVTQIPEPAAWLQVVHGRNLSNRVWGARDPGIDLCNTFGIQAPDLPAIGASHGAQR
jgi:hypothetical protein